MSKIKKKKKKNGKIDVLTKVLLLKPTTKRWLARSLEHEQ